MPDPEPIIDSTQAVFDELASLLEGIQRLAGGGLVPGSADPKSVFIGPTENLLFYFTGNTQQAYAAQYDGRIIGAIGNIGNIGVSIGIDCPSATISTAQVTNQFVIPPTATGSGVLAGNKLNHIFKMGDLIKARNYNAGTNNVILTLCRDIVDPLLILG
jgi:hypothetical protein